MELINPKMFFVDKLNSTAFAPVKMDFQGNIRVSLESSQDHHYC